MDKTSSSIVEYKRSQRTGLCNITGKSKKHCLYCQKKKKERREAKKLAKALRKMCLDKKVKKPKPKPESTPMATDEPTTTLIVIDQST